MTDQEQGKQGGYHVSDLPEGASPDPLGDKSLSVSERVGADQNQEPGQEQGGDGSQSNG